MECKGVSLAASRAIMHGTALPCTVLSFWAQPSALQGAWQGRALLPPGLQSDGMGRQTDAN